MSIGERLEVLHTETMNEPLPEWLDGASCGPAAKHLAHLAIHVADNGQSEADWRAWVHEHIPEVSDSLMSEAETCMRSAGLWPWRH